MILRDESFGSVMKSLVSPSLRDGRDVVDIDKVFGVTRESLRYPSGLDALYGKVRVFVVWCIFFNHEAWRLRYNREGVDAVDVAESLDAVMAKGEVLSLAQLFMTLQCITYNADIRDYLDEKCYAKYQMRVAFEKWMKQAEQLIAELADTIAWRQTHEENCVWG